MSFQEFFEQYPLLKKYLLPIGIGGVGIVCITVGILTSFLTPKQEDISFQNTQSVKGANTVGNGLKPSSTVKQIVVDIEGAIIKGGIYHIDADSRLQDALIAAGGLSENADRSFVEKHVNLAQKLVDGQKIYVPHIGELPISNSQFQISNDSSQSTTETADGAININDATAEQLDALPGIGQVTAQKIINGRPYSDIQELLSKKIVSSKVFAEIKDKISAY